MHAMKRALISYVIIALVPLALQFMPGLMARFFATSSMAAVLRYLPVIIMVPAGLMGWKLNQTRALLVAALNIVIYLLMLYPGFLVSSGVSRDEAVQSVVLGLPLCLLAVELGPEGPVLSPKFAVRLGLCLLPLPVLGALAAWKGGWFAGIALWEIHYMLPAARYLPHITILCLLGLAGGMVFLFEPRARFLMFSSLIAAIPVISAARADLGVQWSPGVQSWMYVVVSFIAVAAIMGHAIFHMYWQRVYLDELTGVPNRRALEERMIHLSGTFSIAMIDIDYFKRFNDDYGHDEGDNVLRMVAVRLGECLGECVYLYGGEEFCAIFERLEKEAAHVRVEAARRNIEEEPFHLRYDNPSRRDETFKKLRGRVEPGRAVSVTISAGVAGTAGLLQSPPDVLRHADAALYEAKRSGRNRVERAE